MQNKPLVCSVGCPVQAGCSAFPFHTPTNPLIPLNFKYKTVIIPKLKIYFYILDIIIKCKYKQKFNFWNVHGIINNSGLLQS